MARSERKAMVFNPKTRSWSSSNSNAEKDVVTKQEIKHSSTSTPNTSDNNSRGAGSKSEAEREYIEREFSTLKGDLVLTSSKRSIKVKVNDTVMLEGFGKNLSGLYYVDEVKRKIDNAGGYKITLNVLKNSFGDGVRELVSEELVKEPVKKNSKKKYSKKDAEGNTVLTPKTPTMIRERKQEISSPTGFNRSKVGGKGLKRFSGSTRIGDISKVDW